MCSCVGVCVFLPDAYLKLIADLLVGRVNERVIEVDEQHELLVLDQIVQVALADVVGLLFGHLDARLRVNDRYGGRSRRSRRRRGMCRLAGAKSHRIVPASSIQTMKHKYIFNRNQLG